jgi:hypothetical protein
MGNHGQPGPGQARRGAIAVALAALVARGAAAGPPEPAWSGQPIPPATAAAPTGVGPTGIRGLPDWARRALRGDERAVRADTCGADCWLVWAAAVDDSLAGRVVRVSRRRKVVGFAEQYAWVRWEPACADGLVRVLNGLGAARAREALEAVRPRLRPGERVLQVQALGVVRLADGHPVEYGQTDAVGVSLRCADAAGGRELAVERTAAGIVVRERDAGGE